MADVQVLLGEGDRRNEMRQRFSLAQKTALGRNRTTSLHSIGPKILSSPPLNNRHSEVRERATTVCDTAQLPEANPEPYDRRRRSQTAAIAGQRVLLVKIKHDGEEVIHAPPPDYPAPMPPAPRLLAPPPDSAPPPPIMIQEPQEPVLLVAGGADSATTTRLRAFARIGPAENLRVRSATYSANVLNAAAGSKFNDQFEDLRALIRERHSTAPSELAPPSAAATAAGVAKTEARRSRAPSMASPLPEADSIAQLLADREELSKQVHTITEERDICIKKMAIERTAHQEKIQALEETVQQQQAEIAQLREQLAAALAASANATASV